MAASWPRRSATAAARSARSRHAGRTLGRPGSPREARPRPGRAARGSRRRARPRGPRDRPWPPRPPPAPSDPPRAREAGSLGQTCTSRRFIQGRGMHAVRRAAIRRSDRERVAVAPRVGSALEGAGLRVAPDALAAADDPRPVLDHVDLVAARREALAHGSRECGPRRRPGGRGRRARAAPRSPPGPPCRTRPRSAASGASSGGCRTSPACRSRGRNAPSRKTWVGAMRVCIGAPPRRSGRAAGLEVRPHQEVVEEHPGARHHHAGAERAAERLGDRDDRAVPVGDREVRRVLLRKVGRMAGQDLAGQALGAPPLAAGDARALRDR